MQSVPKIKDGISGRGAREHNLKNIDFFLPRNQFIVVTGLSGSGKSSLVFDTVFAESQRRFLESMSTYARYFLEQVKRPQVDSLAGLQPAIAIDQKTTSLNPRSTVGTVTEAYDYLRLVFARRGVPYCPTHHLPAAAQKLEQIHAEILRKGSNFKFFLLASVAQQKKGEFVKEIDFWQKKGIQKAKIDGQWVELFQIKKLAKTKPHDIDLVVDQLILKPELSARLLDSLKRGIEFTKGRVVVEEVKGERWLFSTQSSCPECGFSFPELDPRFFSFNSPKGACPTCNGLGTADLVEEEVLDWDGEKKVLKSLKYKSKTIDSEAEEPELRESQVCPDCLGLRLRSEALSVKFNGYNIAELGDWEITKLLEFGLAQQAESSQDIVLTKIFAELNQRLSYLVEVGCGYLSLSRATDSLSGGEAQRLRLASQLGSNLTGVLYVLDEPSIGLHPKDHQKLLHILQRLKAAGNTILVVEHDEETIRAADYIFDVGPRAGRLGGEIIAEGALADILQVESSETSQYLSGKKQAYLSKSQYPPILEQLEIIGASGHNLKNVDLKIPKGHFIAVTGPSGSGKSTLIMDTLYPVVAGSLGLKTKNPKAFKSLKYGNIFDKIIEINQRPIGRTSRSTPLTYVDLAGLVRDVFAQLPEAKIRGFEPSRFSYNSRLGHCPVCKGAGVIKLEMSFLSDVEVTCEACEGQRFNRETLLIRYKGKNIADVLAMTVQEAFDFFAAFPLLRRRLQTLMKVGLEYIQLGQGAPTLSGGEAQRIKLSKELSRKSTGRTLYILDEPTTGLHFQDVRLLNELLQELVAAGNTVVVIEHNMDMVASADWIIELGPEGGKNGGQLVFQGPILEFLKWGDQLNSPTFPYLKSKFL